MSAPDRQALAVMARLRRLREDERLRQCDLADRIGVTRETVAMWESGKRQPTLSMLHRYVHALGGELHHQIIDRQQRAAIADEARQERTADAAGGEPRGGGDE